MKKFLKIIAPIFAAVSGFLFLTSLQPVQAAANSVWFQSNKGSYTSGQSFTVTVYGNAPANIGSPSTNVAVKYPANLLSVVQISVGSGIPTAVATHNTSAQTISLTHSFVGYSGGITDKPLMSITFRTKSTGTAVLSFTESFLRGHTVNKTTGNYTVLPSSCPTGQIGTPPNCSNPPAPAPTPAPTPTPTPAPPRPNPVSSPRPSLSPPPASPATPTPTSNTPDTSAPAAPAPSSSTKSPSVIEIKEVEEDISYTTTSVSWITTGPTSNTTFTYGVNRGSLDNKTKVASAKDKLSHSAQPTDLLVGTTYYYAIVVKKSSSEIITEKGSFTTKAYPVTLRLSDDTSTLANQRISLKGFDETYTTDTKGEVQLSLLADNYTMQLTRNGTTEEHTFTIKALPITSDTAPDTQIISVKTTTLIQKASSEPNTSAQIGVAVGILLLLGTVTGGLIVWVKRSKSDVATNGYQSILDRDVYAGSGQSDYTSQQVNYTGSEQPAYPESGNPSPTYGTPITSPYTYIAPSDEPVDMWSAPSAPTYQTPYAAPQAPVSAPPLSPYPDTPQPATTPSYYTPEETIATASPEPQLETVAPITDISEYTPPQSSSDETTLTIQHKN